MQNKIKMSLIGFYQQTQRFARDVVRLREQYVHYNILPLYAAGIKPAIMELPEVGILHHVLFLFTFILYMPRIPHVYFFYSLNYRSKLHFKLYALWIIFQSPELVTPMTCLRKGLNQSMISLIGFLLFL